ncbi:cytochrome-c peroxidase [Roseateles depolymerans]|uniref:Cytochrome C peroxidase n=1 Tax=Roseateles depolymerans TaxID=76731 RepID=A0A0U3LE31_9BURK|nr:cytochrome c peroxidase [Roseateles depolymerans]ALV06367.1 cytochrome C peroxidase [Roseateles depolymerans]REG19339.1 cytochrome c peroxidase [Roseateles depolymerans]
MWPVSALALVLLLGVPTVFHVRAAWAAVHDGATRPTIAASAQVAKVDPPATPFYASTFQRNPSPAELTELGRQLFHETALSASGRMSCASCHDPAHAYGPPNGRAVQWGGAGAQGVPGLRAVPSLMYRQTTPPFSEHFFDNDGNDAEDQGPTGGFAWDGRAGSAHEQAQAPLLSPFEMANRDRGEVVKRLAASPSASAMRATFGPQVLDDTATGWKGLVLALEVFQQSPGDFAPFSSRYDDYLRGKVTLTAAESRGLRVFNDATRGNCASCHISDIKRGAFPLFTDMGHIALGVPRNPAIPANRQADWYDLGLCGPLRQDLTQHADYCGRFKTPSLRNVATRQVFFHNGSMTRLDQAVRFYAERDVHPERWYPRDAKGRVRKFDDLPPAYHANVNREVPFGGQPGGRATMSEQDIADVVAFLKTLTDAPKAAERGTGKNGGSVSTASAESAMNAMSATRDTSAMSATSRRDATMDAGPARP